jgi:hypothetical protein
MTLDRARGAWYSTHRGSLTGSTASGGRLRCARAVGTAFSRRYGALVPAWRPRPCSLAGRPYLRAACCAAGRAAPIRPPPAVAATATAN